MTLKHSIYYEGVKGFGAGFEFAYAPGPVTNLALIPVNGRWRLIVSEGESIAIKPRPVAAPQMLFKPSSLPIAEWCTKWCEAGSPHHQAVAFGHLGTKIEIYAKMQGLDLVVV